MRVPTRKPGKYAGLKPDKYITKAKYDELQQKLKKLKKYSRPRAIEEVKKLALMGDFSENFAYGMAKGRLRGINQRILDIENRIKRAVIIKPLKNKETVQLGHQVTLEVNSKQKTYQILGSTETNPLGGIISHNSPIGAKLIGKRAGDIIKIKLSKKKVNYKIIKIE